MKRELSWPKTVLGRLRWRLHALEGGPCGLPSADRLAQAGSEEPKSSRFEHTAGDGELQVEQAELDLAGAHVDLAIPRRETRFEALN